MNCPDCDRQVESYRAVCVCGWKVPKAPAMERPRFTLVPPEPIPVDYLPKLLFTKAREWGVPMAEATVKYLPEWIALNPFHPDTDHARTLLAKAEEALQPKGHTDYCTAAQAKREPFVTGPDAEGCKGYCRRCETAKEVLVCWCQRYEACRECLATHVQKCPQAAVITHRV